MSDTTTGPVFRLPAEMMDGAAAWLLVCEIHNGGTWRLQWRYRKETPWVQLAGYSWGWRGPSLSGSRSSGSCG